MRVATRGVVATLLLLTAGFLLSCGDTKSPTSPSSTTLQVTAIAPASGTTLGGTAISIAGTNFAAGATVMIGGAAATSVTFVSDTSITAITPQHTSGAADVVVSAGGKTGTLRSGFTFYVPAKQDNQPPTIATITAKGTGRNEPGGYSDIDETLNVAAQVSDPETAIGNLKFQWSAEVGTITGDGPNVTWTSPHDAATPRACTITLTVVETYQSTDDNGLPATKENKTTGTATVFLHDSHKEIGDMATQFLNDFSSSAASRATVMQNFLDSCQGTSDENKDVDKNRRLWQINAFRPGRADVNIKFGGNCPVHDRNGVDACANVPWQWTSTCKITGQTAISTGSDQVGAVYQGNRWWLCSSDWTSSSQVGPGDTECENGVKK
jgi:hypothetical protein